MPYSRVICQILRNGRRHLFQRVSRILASIYRRLEDGISRHFVFGRQILFPVWQSYAMPIMSYVEAFFQSFLWNNSSFHFNWPGKERTIDKSLSAAVGKNL